MINLSYRLKYSKISLYVNWDLANQWTYWVFHFKIAIHISRGGFRPFVFPFKSRHQNTIFPVNRIIDKHTLAVKYPHFLKSFAYRLYSTDIIIFVMWLSSFKIIIKPEIKKRGWTITSLMQRGGAFFFLIHYLRYKTISSKGFHEGL